MPVENIPLLFLNWVICSPTPAGGNKPNEGKQGFGKFRISGSGAGARYLATTLICQDIQISMILLMEHLRVEDFNLE